MTNEKYITTTRYHVDITGLRADNEGTKWGKPYKIYYTSVHSSRKAANNRIKQVEKNPLSFLGGNKKDKFYDWKHQIKRSSWRDKILYTLERVG